jgi:hypothetical protein
VFKAKNKLLLVLLLTAFFLGLIIRLIFIIKEEWNEGVGGDFIWYHYVAANILSGKGISFDFSKYKHFGYPTALHPPLFAFILVIGDLLGINTGRGQIIINGVLGSFSILTTGILAKVIYKKNIAGIIAAFIAAIYPGYFIYDGQGLSEPTEVLVLTLVLIAAYKFLAHSNYFAAVYLGAGIGILSLARSEQILTVFLIGLPAALKAQGNLGKRLRLFGVMIICCAIVLSPWVIRNLIVFKYPETLSTQLGVTLETANCNSTYYGPFAGYWDFNCSKGISLPKDESVMDKKFRNIALNYINTHLGRFFEIMPYRIGRILNIYQPFEQAQLNYFEGWPHTEALMELWSSWFVMAFAIGGIIFSLKEKITIFPLISQYILLILVAALIYGNSRYRASSEVSNVIFASYFIYRIRSLFSLKPSRSAAKIN